MTTTLNSMGNFPNGCRDDYSALRGSNMYLSNYREGFLENIVVVHKGKFWSETIQDISTFFVPILTVCSWILF